MYRPAGGETGPTDRSVRDRPPGSGRSPDDRRAIALSPVPTRHDEAAELIAGLVVP